MLAALSIIHVTYGIVLFLLCSPATQAWFNLITWVTDLKQKTKLNLALNCKTAGQPQ